jgi:predicted O-methyltransferase YrrM
VLGSALHYALHYPRRLAGALATDPIALLDKLQDGIVQQWEYRNPVHYHEPSRDWERELHRWLGVGHPCEHQAELYRFWPEMLRSVRAHGVDIGPASFAGYNDGDAALLRAIWCLMRHVRPRQVVETGVAHGLTSRIALEALERNGAGHLSSIDRPPFDPTMRERVGLAVPQELRGRWKLIAGSSRRCLPGLLARTGPIDLFIHDSLHTERNVRFELDHAWAALRPGGAMIIDDIDTNGGFAAFCRASTGFKSLVCEAEPIRPDERRFNQKGLFAIVLKGPFMAAAAGTAPAS